MYKVGLWLILASILNGPSLESKFAPINRNSQTATSTYFLSSWPVVGTDSVFICNGSLTFTPPSAVHSVQLNCAEHGCTPARRTTLNRQTSSAASQNNL